MFILKVDKHLTLETLKPQDAQQFHQLAVKNLPRLFWWHDIHLTEAFVKGLLSRVADKSWRFHTIWLGGVYFNHQLIGSVSLNTINWQQRVATLGYWLDADFTGQGIIHRCAEKLVHYCFSQLKLRTIEIHCHADNTASIAVANRLGFEIEQKLRQAGEVDGKVVDIYVFRKRSIG
ncbi:GNAT family N-acetyltransferase [Zooshikella ganghwensis]|uniref:N-acetyltransferase n=1 Tax=Zooshikella ganghwensis TaxID=202772 RepID=A0A4P9VLF5_9GAMM|nr:GNAT family protein [Zooshikella ganghwensis]RDH42682.1 N-acetyltransferase [Zooshikella ganghwensis]